MNHVALNHSSISEKKFVSNLQDNLLTQHVTFATRARGTDHPSILDLVLANNDIIDNIANLSPLGKSDHSVLMIECSINFFANKKQKLNLNKGDYNGLTNFIQNEFHSAKANNILDNKNCVEAQWQFFKNSLINGIEKYIPVTEHPLKILHRGSNH